MAMLSAFTFEEGGRTYHCTPETRGDPSRGSWWWFTVSNDTQRYARFEASAADTRTSVRTRIVEYYEHRLWVRAQPVVPRQRFGHPVKPAAPAPAPQKG
jgi:hypothetical protein